MAPEILDETWPPTLLELLHWSQSRPASAVSKRARAERLLHELSPPPHGPIVKITGTNGKGSTCALLEAFTRAGSRIPGLFTSPHLSRITERFRIDGQEIDPGRLEAHARRLLPRLRSFVAAHGDAYIPSFFEALLLLGLELFREAKVDLILLEAGIGGYNDATSLVPGALSAITTLGLDHRKELGDTLELIAADKAGIATPGSTLVLGPDIRGSSLEAIRHGSARRGVTLLPTSRADLRPVESGLRGSTLELQWRGAPTTVQLSLVGRFQWENLLVAAKLLELLQDRGELPAGDLLAGAARAVWPGRLELIPGDPAWLLDVAHNAHGFDALESALQDLVPFERRVLLYGASADKDYASAMEKLEGLAPEMYLVGGFYRAADPGALAARLPVGARSAGHFASPYEAFRRLGETFRGSEHTVVAAGSVFLVGEMRRALLARAADSVCSPEGRPDPSPSPVGHGAPRGQIGSP